MSSDFEIDNSAGQTGATGLNHNQWNVVAGDSSSDAQHLRSGRSTQQPCSCCTRCWTTGCTWLTSALGVSLLLFVYLITGAVMFMVLGNHETMASSDHSRAQTTGHVRPGHHHHADPDARLLDKTMATVDRLWSITEDLNILYRDNWTHLARVEMRHYQDQIVRTLRQIMLEERYSFRQTWTFPMSLLYALTLITTIGKKILQFSFFLLISFCFRIYLFFKLPDCNFRIQLASEISFVQGAKKKSFGYSVRKKIK